MTSTIKITNSEIEQSVEDIFYTYQEFYCKNERHYVVSKSRIRSLIGSSYGQLRNQILGPKLVLFSISKEGKDSVIRISLFHTKVLQKSYPFFISMKIRKLIAGYVLMQMFKRNKKKTEYFSKLCDHNLEKLKSYLNYNEKNI